MGPFNAREKFLEYFNESEGFCLRSERFYSEFIGSDINPDTIVKWLEAAYTEGARAMADDTIHTLRQYGTATAGINQPLYTPTESYDHAAENLAAYYASIF